MKSIIVRIVFLLFVNTILLSTSATAQNQTQTTIDKTAPVQDTSSPKIAPSDTSELMKKDTICFKLNFNPGDSLLYKVFSDDSIVIDFGTPLMKKRIETILVTCDSVKEGRFFLSQKLFAYEARESHGSEPMVETFDSPWIGRIAWFEIDSVGNRYSYGEDDETTQAMCPGSAFQPHLFFTFGESCKAIEESWIVSTTDNLPANGVPEPIVRQSSLFRAKEKKDTLGYKCNRMEYIKTAQGSMALVTERDSIRVTSILTSYGSMFLGTEYFVPVFYFSTLEEKLTLNFKGGIIKPGSHNISTYYNLVSYKPAPEMKAKKPDAKKRKRK